MFLVRAIVSLESKTRSNRMSFTITTHDGMRVEQWFRSVDELIKSMLANPKDRYWRNR